MLRDVRDDRLVRIELWGWHAAAGKNALLPVALHGGDRAVQDAFGEATARRRLRLEIDRAHRLPAVPARDLFQECVRQELPGRLRGRIVGVNDDSVTRAFVRQRARGFW